MDPRYSIVGARPADVAALGAIERAGLENSEVGGDLSEHRVVMRIALESGKLTK